jgi:hypothetical protein
MALTTSVSVKELERIASLAYEGETIKVMLCSVGTTGLPPPTGLGYSYDSIVIYVEGNVYPHSVITESPNVVLMGGQTQTYRITLASDD